MKLALIAVGILLYAGRASAEVELQTLGWRIAAPAKPGQPKAPEAIETLRLAGDGRIPGKLAGTVKIVSRGTPVEGVLLRYTVAAKLQPKDGAKPGAWAVPYLLEERRVPKIKANAYVDIPLDAAVWTEAYFKKLDREGYRAVELKMQVMIEPRPGHVEGIKVLEAALPVEGTAK